MERELRMLRQIIICGMQAAGEVASVALMAFMGVGIIIHGMHEMAAVAVAVVMKLYHHAGAERQAQRHTHCNAPKRSPSLTLYVVSCHLKKAVII